MRGRGRRREGENERGMRARARARTRVREGTSCLTFYFQLFDLFHYFVRLTF